MSTHRVFETWDNNGWLDKVFPAPRVRSTLQLPLGSTWREAAMWSAKSYVSPYASSIVIGVREEDGTVHLVDVTRTVTMDVRFAHCLPSQVTE